LCANSYRRVYRELNRTKIKEEKKRYYERNRTKVDAANKKWLNANPENRKEHLRKSNAKRKHANYAFHIKKKYGLSIGDYNAILESQGGVCAANGCLETAFGGKLSVDHDHATGKVRGLLCHGCNTTLGRMGDSIEKLKGLITYLERSN